MGLPPGGTVRSLHPWERQHSGRRARRLPNYGRGQPCAGRDSTPACRSSGSAASPTRCGSPLSTPSASTAGRATASTARRWSPEPSLPRSATRRSSPTAADRARTGSSPSASRASRSRTCWPRLTDAERHRAVDQLAVRLAALHRTPAPPDLPPIEKHRSCSRSGAADPTGAGGRGAPSRHAARSRRHGDARRCGGAGHGPGARARAVRGRHARPRRRHLRERAVARGPVTALLDVEWARPGPRDLDLDILLRCAAYPSCTSATSTWMRPVPTTTPRSRGGWPGLPRPLRVPAADRPRAGVLHRLRRARPPGVTAPGDPRHLPALHAYHRLSGSWSVRATSTTSAEAAPPRALRRRGRGWSR